MKGTVDEVWAHLQALREGSSRKPPGRRPITENLDEETALRKWRRVFELYQKASKYNYTFEKKNPLVTVCIATADRPFILRDRALHSIASQEYQNIEVIVVGDCCDDRTEEVVRAIGDPRIKYFNLPVRGPYPRPGIDRWRVAGTYPMNFALMKAEGDFITHLDEDDTYEPSRIAELVSASQDEKADLVFHPFSWQQEDHTWTTLGNGVFELGQTGTGLVLYHNWFAKVPWDVRAYLKGEPGDWNRLRKIKALGARIHYVNKSLSHHWKYPLRDPFSLKPNEAFLDD